MPCEAVLPCFFLRYIHQTDLVLRLVTRGLFSEFGALKTRRRGKAPQRFDSLASTPGVTSRREKKRVSSLRDRSCVIVAGAREREILSRYK